MTEIQTVLRTGKNTESLILILCKKLTIVEVPHTCLHLHIYIFMSLRAYYTYCFQMYFLSQQEALMTLLCFCVQGYYFNSCMVLMFYVTILLNSEHLGYCQLFVIAKKVMKLMFLYTYMCLWYIAKYSFRIN